MSTIKKSNVWAPHAQDEQGARRQAADMGPPGDAVIAMTQDVNHLHHDPGGEHKREAHAGIDPNSDGSTAKKRKPPVSRRAEIP